MVSDRLTPLERVLDRLKGVKAQNGYFIAFCPSHDDRRERSLSISEGEDGRALLNCFAGCDYTDVVAALGLSVVDLFAHNGHPGSEAQRAKKGREPKSKTKSEPQQTVVTTDELPDGTYWEFTSVGGEVLYIQRHKGAYYQKTGEDRWKDDLEGVSQVLYRLPELIDGVSAGETVYHVEGPKDVETARERLGLCVTTSGSTSSWRPEFKSYYAGADVVIVPDNDDPGRKYADTVAQDLVGVARSVKVVHLPDLAERDDLTDWLDAGHTKEEFFALVEKTLLYDGTEAEPHPSEVEAVPHANGSSVTIKTLADAITVEDHFARDAGDKLYRFSGGCYRQYAERYIRQRVKELLEAWGKADKWSSHKASEVAEYILADAPELWEKPPHHEVNLANGILNLETRALREHDSAFLSPVQVPVRYDASEVCPAWEKFVSEVFPNDAHDLAFELAADLITPSRSEQRSVLLLGEGSNGKSTYLRALTAFVGSTNAAGVSLHKLESDRFATARLVGKLANICPDLPSTHLTETSVFKAITGGDAVHAEYKYRDSFEFVPFCRLVFSANHVPRSGDASHAFFRRWLVVPFDRTFEPQDQVPRETLDADLSDPAELSGVLNRALEVLGRIRRDGFTESESMREAWEEFKAMTDPLSVWLANNTVAGAITWVAKSVLIAAFNKAAEDAGRAGFTSQAFGRAMKRARPEVGEAQRTVGGRQVKCYTGIGLKGGDGPGEDDPGGDEPEGVGGEGDAGTTATTDTTDSTIVTSSGMFSETLHKQDKKNEVGEPEITNKGNGSIGSSGSKGGGDKNNNIGNLVNRVNPCDPTYTTVSELFANPPSWLPGQLKVYRTNPQRHFKPLCNTVAAVVLGDPLRGEEVAEEVRKEVSRTDSPRRQENGQ